MRITLFLFFLVFAYSLMAQVENVPVMLFRKGHQVKEHLEIKAFCSDSTLVFSDSIPASIIKACPIAICYHRRSIYIGRKEESIPFVKVYYDRKSLHKVGKEAGMFELLSFRKQYVIDYGLDVIEMAKISKKKWCRK